MKQASFVSSAEPQPSADGRKISPTMTPRRTRAFSAVAFALLVGGAGLAAREGYHAATDSFVAPTILSPDSEIVLQTKAKTSELEVDRARARTECEDIDVDLATGDRLLARLTALRETVTSSLDWTKTLAAQKEASSRGELRELERQRELLSALGASAPAANVTGSDGFAPLQVALLENDRARIQNEAALSGAQQTRLALAGRSGPMTPEAVMREEQLVRIELEMARITTEQRARRAAKTVLLTKLRKMDELEAQLRNRPLFRATQGALDVAFVPYTQEAGVVPGAEVYRCTWSIVHCEAVGTVAEIIPGEVILPDPWGSPARGQYAVLSLSSHEAAKAKVLRVRGSGARPPQPATSGEHVASAR